MTWLWLAIIAWLAAILIFAAGYITGASFMRNALHHMWNEWWDSLDREVQEDGEIVIRTGEKLMEVH